MRDRSYPIVVGEGCLREIAGLCASVGIPLQRAFVIADARLKRPREVLLRALEGAGCVTESVAIEASEQAKDYRAVFPIYARLLEAGMDRHSVLFALGGGVIGDLSGFVAGTYLRGIRWVGIPTTLLAQVDSSIGGKTGVNHPEGKNLIGVFHQPSLVVCDTDLLDSLSARDRVSGLGEIAKYGLAFDPKFFAYLEKHWEPLLELEPAVLKRAVATSVRWKARVVAADELETRGLRARLNFGHTLGHAIEAATGFRHFRHGEAVVLGMRLAAALSVERGHLSETAFARVEAFLSRFPQPRPPRLSLERVMRYVRRDKKAKEGKVAFVLLKNIGRTVSDREVGEKEIAAAFRRLALPLRIA